MRVLSEWLTSRLRRSGGETRPWLMLASLAVAAAITAAGITACGADADPSGDEIATQQAYDLTSTVIIENSERATPPSESEPIPTPTLTDAAVTQVAEAVAAATAAAPTATTAPEQSSSSTFAEREFDIVTLLAPDAIPAISNPGFYESPEEAADAYHDDMLVLGIEINGDARAYSVPFLSRHEIVNDYVGGKPVAVTW